MGAVYGCIPGSANPSAGSDRRRRIWNESPVRGILKNMKNIVLYSAALAVLVAAGATFTAGIGGNAAGRRQPSPGRPGYSASNIVEESRALEVFDSITLPGSGKVRIRIGAEPSVRIRADGRSIGRIVTEVRGTELVISERAPSIPFSGPAEIDVVAPSLKAVRISGSGDLEILDPIEGTALEIRITGSGSVSAEVELHELSVDIAGSGDVRVGGRSGTMTLRIMGSGDLDASDLEGDTASVTIMGSGDGTIGTFASIDATIAGSGDLRYAGSPRIKSSTPGSGELIHR